MQNLIKIILFWFSGIIAGSQFSKFALISQILQNTYGLDLVYSNFLISSLGILGIIFGASIGIVVGRYSPRKLIIFSLLLASLISFIQTIIPLNSFFLVIRIFEGITQLILVTAAPTAMLLESNKKYQAYIMALWGTFFSVAFTISNTIGPLMIAKWSWQSFFYLHSISALMIGTFLLFLSPSKVLIKPNTELQKTNIFKQHINIYTSFESSLPGFLFGIHTLFFMLLIIFLPKFFNETYSDQTYLFSLLLTLLPLVSLAGTFTSGTFTNLFNGSPLLSIIVVFAIQAVLITIICIFNIGATFLFITSLLILINSGLIQGLIFITIPFISKNPKDHAHANGAVSQLGNMGATIGIPIFSILLVNFNWSVALLFPTFCCLTGLIVSIIGHKKYSQKHSLLHIGR